MGATKTLERIAVSLGMLHAPAPAFEASLDVTYAGVLFALPALLVCGLLHHTEKHFQLPRGYYRLDSIFLLLAFMALSRIKAVEDLRYAAPGEWGKALGLDRIPEAKTLREKIRSLSNEERPSHWAADLSAEWMKREPEAAAVFYVDGHVRVYSGSQTDLPKHYVSRQKLCLRATVDYWVNAMGGRPFFFINKEVDPGLISVLEEEIIPRLLRDTPDQPTEEALKDNPHLHRLTVIFDREGYSPALFARLRKRRIACVTYRKNPGEAWPETEFTSRQVVLSSGNVVEMLIAERGVLMGSLWLREVRKLTESGHQTSILATDYVSDMTVVAVAMFARWSQENFLKYMRNHFNLDRLIEYSTEEIPDTTKVVNPEYRRIAAEIRKQRGMHTRLCAQFGAITFTDEIEPGKAEVYQQKKAALQEEIGNIQQGLEGLKQRRKETKRHIPLSDLPEEERFQRLSVQSKYLIDTIKMVAYRAETVMASLICEKMSHPDEARSLLRALYAAEADILPDPALGTLTVRLHHLANRGSGEVLRHLCSELNSTETVFPGTNLRLNYELVS
jgi:hypothetical protein